MPRIKTKPIRASENFTGKLDRIKIQRVKSGLDKRTISDARLTEGMANDPSFTELLNKLSKMPRRR